MPYPLPYLLPSLLPGPLTADDGNATSATGGSAGTLAEYTSHAAGALALLIQQYQDSPLLQSLLNSYLERVQELESGLVGVYERALSVEDGEGVNLDLIGRIVREARDGRADYAYRLGLRTRILINRSQGRLEDLIAIVRLFEDMDTDGGTVRIQDVQPARVEVRADNTRINPLGEIHRRLRRAKAAGVSLQTIGTVAPGATPATAFRLVTVAEAESKSEIGLAPEDSSFGGYLSHVLE